MRTPPKTEKVADRAGATGGGNVSLSDVSRVTGDGLEVDILVSPRSDRSGLEGFDEWRKRLVVRVKAPPLEGRANKEVEGVFRDLIGFRSEVVSGHLSRQKTVLIRGGPEEIRKILERHV
ncbi:MAG: DUF167 family protein [Candidatus Methanoplasma sp.]|jgi:uncharacterized protein (TIGR00251 family)|nr:DUF167 family protein [Candidatus Methanoplasma sp.]